MKTDFTVEAIEKTELDFIVEAIDNAGFNKLVAYNLVAGNVTKREFELLVDSAVDILSGEHEHELKPVVAHIEGDLYVFGVYCEECIDFA